ncbi:MAG: T9SS type A sorting domain-containing protein, partial [Tannerella sp.]|nr:T9SS type A sorting domain-containing protein [Tannerella sp.]
AQLAFPASAGASYYLVHLYELRSTGSAPVLTLKVTPDGRVTLRAAAAASLAVPLSYLTPGATYAVTVETVRETGGRAEVIRTEVTAFTTPAAPVGLDAPDADAPRASCNGSTLRLERLDGYDCTLTTVGGQTVDRFRVTDVLEQRLLTLPAGIYILTAVNANRQVAFKIVVSG